MAIVVHKGMRAAQFYLREIERRTVDVTPALKALRQIPVNASKEAFARQRDPVDNNRWDRLAVSTIKKKIDKSGGRRGPGKILSPRPDKGNAMKNTIRSTAVNNQLIVGTNRVSKGGFPYPTTHQTGTRPGKRPIVPQRTFMGYSIKTTEIIMDVVAEYVLKGTVNGRPVGRRRPIGAFGF
jgi:phage gpG-like protein